MPAQLFSHVVKVGTWCTRRSLLQAQNVIQMSYPNLSTMHDGARTQDRALLLPSLPGYCVHLRVTPRPRAGHPSRQACIVTGMQNGRVMTAPSSAEGARSPLCAPRCAGFVAWTADATLQKVSKILSSYTRNPEAVACCATTAN
eukprot:jgi/Ulvmu1/4969/UM207_0013.1